MIAEAVQQVVARRLAMHEQRVLPGHPAFALEAAPIHADIAQISDPYLQKQMTVPIALSHLLPVGIKGLFVAIMIMGLVAGDSGHLHSWGSIFVQDVILPLKKKAMSPTQHIWALRLAVMVNP